MNYGETLASSVSDYLSQNKLSSLGSLNRNILSDIAQRTYDAYTKSLEAKEKALSDDQWLGKLQEKEGEMGLNVRVEYARAKVWFEENHQQLTRKRFVDWLKKADRPLSLGDSKAKEPIRHTNLYQEPAFDWRRLIATKWPRELMPDRPAYEEMPWLQISITVRAEVLKAQPL